MGFNVATGLHVAAGLDFVAGLKNTLGEAGYPCWSSMGKALDDGLIPDEKRLVLLDK